MITETALATPLQDLVKKFLDDYYANPLEVAAIISKFEAALNELQGS